MKCKCLMASGVALLLVLLASPAAHGQTLLTQTTWGGTGSDVADGVATASAPDGSAYVVGISDSFTVDQFGTPSPRIFVVKFATDGSLTWQRIWNGTTIRGLGRPGVAVDSAGSVYVTGMNADNGGDAVLLKFDSSGTLAWERTWGGAASDQGKAVATAADGSVYIAGTETSFGPSSFGLFVVKFDSNGNLLWQKTADGAEGSGVAVGSDGNVYAAGTMARDLIGNFDMLVLKIAADGTQVWRRIYTAGDVADARGRVAVGPDGSIVVAGALQTTKAGSSDIAALIVKISAAGNLIFDKQFDGRVNETADGVAVAADDGSIYVAGTTTSFGAGFEDAFVLHLQSTGKKLLGAVTWGGTAFETGAGVAVGGATVVLAATTSAAPPYSLLNAGVKLSAPRGSLSVAPGLLDPGLGVVGNPAAGAVAPNGSTTYGGNFEAALVRMTR
jgi:hypothetical protein